jgi:type IV pilus assembly protein PilA
VKDAPPIVEQEQAMIRKKTFAKRGFTLVELMIVVAIIGVLAALAIYGVRRYLASSKTSEAKNTIGAISRGAAGAYERETAPAESLVEGTSSADAVHALCASSTIVPSGGVPAGKKYQPITKEGSDYDSGDTTTGWKCLKFNLTQAHYFEYRYTRGANVAPSPPKACGDVNCFEVTARGDLDGDTTLSHFAQYGFVNTTTKALTVSTQLNIQNEFE